LIGKTPIGEYPKGEYPKGEYIGMMGEIEILGEE
jgi:hypothetical protein